MTSPSPRTGLLARSPSKLWLLFGLVAFGALLTWAVYFGGVNDAAAGVQTVTKDSIPSVVAAQEIRQGFYRMDGDTVANYLELTHGRPAPYDINQDRLQLARQLVVAAQNITYGDAEGDPIRDMVGRLPMYAELTSPALEGQGNWRARRLLMASGLLHQQLVEDANQLDKVNREHLTTAYEESESALRGRNLIEWVVGLAFLLLLGGVQFVLAKRTHRFINPSLAAATLLALLMVFMNARLMGYEAKELKIAKEDAFDSVGYLSEAQADGADARALALYGLIPEGKTPSWAACEQELTNLASADDDQLATDYAETNPPQFKGLLGNELRNITFDGERDAANRELHAYKEMFDTIHRISATENSAGISRAVQRAFSSDQGLDNEYDAYESAVGGTKEINQKQFELARDEAVNGLTLPRILLHFCAALIVSLAYFGIRVRAAEYG